MQCPSAAVSINKNNQFGEELDVMSDSLEPIYKYN